MREQIRSLLKRRTRKSPLASFFGKTRPQHSVLPLHLICLTRMHRQSCRLLLLLLCVYVCVYVCVCVFDSLTRVCVCVFILVSGGIVVALSLGIKNFLSGNSLGQIRSLRARVFFQVLVVQYKYRRWR